MSKLKVLTGFIPWAVFSLITTREGPAGVTTAALLAYFVAGAFLIVSIIRVRSPKVLEVTAAVVFAAFGFVAGNDPGTDAFLTDYGRSLAALVLAVVIFVLLPVLPFTEQYARETVPEQYWRLPRFRSINRRISAAWGAAIGLMAVSHALAATLTEPGPAVDLLLNWVVPAALLLCAALYTSRARTSTPEKRLVRTTAATRSATSALR